MGCTTTTAMANQFITLATWRWLRLGVQHQSKKRGMSTLGNGETHCKVYCLTEPGSGSDASRQCVTCAKEQSQVTYKWLLKCLSFLGAMGANPSSGMLCSNRAKPVPGGVSAFVVPADATRVSEYGKQKKQNGLNAQTKLEMITFVWCFKG